MGTLISPLTSSPFKNLPAPTRFFWGCVFFLLSSVLRRERGRCVSLSADGPERVLAGLERTGLPAGALGERHLSQAARQRGQRGVLAGCALPRCSPAAWVRNQGRLPRSSEERMRPGTQHPWVLAAPAQSSAGRVDWGLGSWTALGKEPESLTDGGGRGGPAAFLARF